MLVVIFDNSVLTAMVKMDKLSLLRCVFERQELLIPQQVFNEFRERHQAALDQFTVVEEIEVPGPLREHGNFSKFGKGEIGGLSIALQRHEIFVTDDNAARTCAIDLGISVIGTLGVFLKGWDKGCFEDEGDYFRSANLLINDLFISEKLIGLLFGKIGKLPPK